VDLSGWVGVGLGGNCDCGCGILYAPMLGGGGTPQNPLQLCNPPPPTFLPGATKVVIKELRITHS